MRRTALRGCACLGAVDHTDLEPFWGALAAYMCECDECDVLRRVHLTIGLAIVGQTVRRFHASQPTTTRTAPQTFPTGHPPQTPPAN